MALIATLLVALTGLVPQGGAGTPAGAPWLPAAAPGVGWSGGSGPVLVITAAGNGFTRYLPEILGSEGFGGEFTETDVSEVGLGTNLAAYSRIVLGDTAVPADTARILASWTRAGGTLVATHPSATLAPLFGLGPATGAVRDGYLRITDPELSSAVFAGTLQYHGTADLRPLRPGTRALALLYSDATTATPFPAVTSRTVGTRGGRAIAFAYDLARSVVATRQGNAGWAGQNRDSPTGPDGRQVCEPTDCLKRTDDLFTGPTGNWVDLTRNQVPQADLQQRLLANLLEEASPLPRLWYLPAYEGAPGSLLKAAVVLTGDDHGNHSQTVRRFTAELDDPRQPAGCGQDGTPVDPAVVGAWRCFRGTSYAYVGAISDAAATRFGGLGFEVAPHVSDAGACPSRWRSADEFDARIFGTDIRQWASWYRTTAASFPPLTERVHCVQWNDWLGTATVEARYGITLDTAYYQWPQALFGAYPGLMTGSGLPQRLAGADGVPAPVWQATTQITDETPSTNTPDFLRQLLDNATGPAGWYGVFTANEHLDDLPESNAAAAAIVDVAATAQVPVISARQLAEWEAARTATRQDGLAAAGSTVTWTLARPATHAMQLVPVGWGTKSLRSLTVGGRALGYTTQVVDGVAYALVPDAAAGAYTARYA